MIRRQRIALALHHTRSIRYRALPLGVALEGLLKAIYARPLADQIAHERRVEEELRALFLPPPPQVHKVMGPIYFSGEVLRQHGIDDPARAGFTRVEFEP